MILLIVLLVSFLLQPSIGIEDYELDLYDLVEEVNGTFYEFMGLEKDCMTSDVRRAYRKLSLVLHPDKNKNDDAEVMFRQLVGIYEVLKSPEKKERYNDILVNGLPTWRQPLYYYRKVRKFGFAESFVVVVIIVSIIHYAMVWAAFWEKCYEIEEVFQGRMKKGTKRKNHQELNEDLEEAMKRALDSLAKPNLSRLLICQLAVALLHLAKNTPSYLMVLIRLVQLQIKPPPEEPEPESEEDEGRESRRKVRRCDEVFSNMATPEMAVSIKPVIYQEPTAPVSVDTENITNGTTKKIRWTNDDDSKLARAMQKFPVGTALRWEKIAQQLNHSPAEILSRAKQLKSRQFNSASSESEPTVLPEIKKKAADCKPQGGISYREECVGPDSPAPAMLTTAPLPEWSQPQQKALENALATVPKTAADRWGDIAALVPGKNKVECMTRYKHIATAIKQRKLNSSNPP